MLLGVPLIPISDKPCGSQCYDAKDRLLAVYEYGVDDVFFAKLDIKQGAENMVTEIVTTLLLNRHNIHRS